MFQDSELQAIASAAPRDRDSLREAVASDKADKYALELLDRACPEHRSHRDDE